VKVAAQNFVTDRSTQLGSKLRSLVHPRWILVLALLPVLFQVVLVVRYAVPIPFRDDWEMAELIAKAHTGTLRFSDIFEQQQEARTVFPKLIFILLAMGGNWDVRVEMMLSILICCLTSLGIYWLLRRSALSALASAIAFLLMVLLIFSPVQQELWLWASGFPSFIPALCVVWGLVVVTGNFSVRAKFALCLALAVFSSFTLANGLLAWGLTFPVLLLIERVPNWKRWAGAWGLACVACAVVYFWGYGKSQELPPFAPTTSLLAYGQYILAFLGGGLGRVGLGNPLVATTLIGATLIFLYLAVAGHAVFRKRSRDYRARVLPWLTLGSYSIISGCLAALGRIGWGVPQALESRYVPFSLYLTVAVIALVAIMVHEKANSSPRPQSYRTWSIGAVILAAIYLALELNAAIASVPLLAQRSAFGRLGQGGILFSPVLDTSHVVRLTNHPRPEIARRNAHTLDRLHLLPTPLVRTKTINALRHAEAEGEAASGWFDGLRATEQGQMAAWGWAVLPSKRRPADCIVLAYENEKAEWILFAISHLVLRRPDVATSLNDREQLWSGWAAAFAQEAIPKGAKISAWAVDAKSAKLYRLKTRY
jgi:hypothetical protein